MDTEKDNWLTTEAREALDAWLRQHHTWWELEGVDAEEVRHDLEAHLWRSRASEDEKVDLAQVEEAVDEMGFPTMKTQVELPVAEVKSGCLSSMLWGLWDTVKNPSFLGVWPLLVVLWELIMGTLASMFFDPMSRVSQVNLLIVFATLGILGMIPRFQKSVPQWLIFLRGAGSVVAAYWAILLLPVIIVGTVYYIAGIVMTVGIGLLAFPIYILCVLTAAAPWLLCWGFVRSSDSRLFSSSGIVGMLIGLGLLLIVEGPSYVTRYGVANQDPALIRDYGSDEALLTMCYEGNVGRRSLTDTTGFLTGLPQYITNQGTMISSAEREQRREMYYRVTGRAFNSESQPGFLTGWSPRRGELGVVFDPDLGGDGVSARVAGLDLAVSRLDGHVDAASGLGYWEWTMEFSNTGDWNQEARMQVLLPNDGVVSRLTLWVNGEPQEAAFSATSKVTAAYKAIAVQERRDPVLVRWVGANRVMVQCFPVLTTEKMKIRFGVTAPLDEKGRFFLPRIIEKNFGVSKELETKLWVQGDTEMQMEGLEGNGARDKWREVHGSLSAKSLMAKHTHVQCQLSEQPTVVWTEDLFADSESKTLIRTRASKQAPQTEHKAVLVIDGSVYFQDWAEAADDAIKSLRESGYELSLVVAVQEETVSAPEKLADLEFAGGQNCVPALEVAMNQAQEIGAHHLIWLHGAQPIEFGEEEGFLQLLERGFHRVKLSMVDLNGGPNRLLEKVSKRVALAGYARPSEPSELEGELSRLLAATSSAHSWETKAVGEAPADAVQVWDQLARWRVWKMVQEAALHSRDHEELAKLAAKYQLVTPVSGAVVLESKAQYKRFDLEQADASKTSVIPGVPEPSTILLNFIGVLLVWRRRRS